MPDHAAVPVSVRGHAVSVRRHTSGALGTACRPVAHSPWRWGDHPCSSTSASRGRSHDTARSACLGMASAGGGRRAGAVVVGPAATAGGGLDHGESVRRVGQGVWAALGDARGHLVSPDLASHASLSGRDSSGDDEWAPDHPVYLAFARAVSHHHITVRSSRVTVRSSGSQSRGAPRGPEPWGPYPSSWPVGPSGCDWRCSAPGGPGLAGLAPRIRS
jgi:hypothetical protein